MSTRPAPFAFGVVTLFTELLEAFAGTSLVGKAIEAGVLSMHLEDLRRHGLGKHLSVDDTPYGGGAGMVLRVDCVVAALEAASQRMQCQGAPKRILLTPRGRPFTQGVARELAGGNGVLLVCGRYEGFDARVQSHVDEELSLGDFVLAGGEVAAMAVVEAVARLVPGVLGNSESTSIESFGECSQGQLEFPQYTRPREFRGDVVPEVLFSGDHGRVHEWRQQQSRADTAERRPDLLDVAPDDTSG